MTELIELANAQDEARRRAAAIAVDQWDLPTPCTDWSIRDIITHLLEVSRMVPLLLQGVTVEDLMASSGPDRQLDLTVALDRALTDELAAFETADDLDMIVHHPGAGDIPAARLLQFRTTDYLLHGWDIARATGADEHLPEGLVVATWTRMEPMAAVIAKIGAYGSGPSGTIPENAPLQQRLLDLTGRRP
jgi:uncharacterized protein (TIGR03086 family)